MIDFKKNLKSGWLKFISDIKMLFFVLFFMFLCFGYIVFLISLLGKFTSAT